MPDRASLRRFQSVSERLRNARPDNRLPASFLDIREADTGRLGSAVRRGVVHVRRERTEE